MGGPEDWRALFHEAGHTEHFAHTRADLPFEAPPPRRRRRHRRLGDAARAPRRRSRLARAPPRLRRGPTSFAAEARRVQLYFAPPLLRPSSSTSSSSTASADLEADARTATSRSLRDATKIEPAPADYLADVDAGFYASGYLRSWAFEAQLRRFLREEFGHAWFARREAGSLLRELWNEGQRLDADEMLREVTGAELDARRRSSDRITGASAPHEPRRDRRRRRP